MFADGARWRAITTSHCSYGLVLVGVGRDPGRVVLAPVVGRLIVGRLRDVAGLVLATGVRLVVVRLGGQRRELVELGQVDRTAGLVGDDRVGQDERERLAAADLGPQRAELAAALQRVGVLLGVHAVLLGAAQQGLDQLGLGDLERLLGGDLVEDELGLE